MRKQCAKNIRNVISLDKITFSLNFASEISKCLTERTQYISKKFDQHSNTHRFQWTNLGKWWLPVSFINVEWMAKWCKPSRYASFTLHSNSYTSSENAESSVQGEQKKKKDIWVLSYCCSLSNDSSCKRDNVSATRRFGGLFHCWNQTLRRSCRQTMLKYYVNRNSYVQLRLRRCSNSKMLPIRFIRVFPRMKQPVTSVLSCRSRISTGR